MVTTPNKEQATTAIANVNLAMLDRAVEQDNSFVSVMSALNRIKVYNPAPNEAAEPDKAGKIKIDLAGSSDYIAALGGESTIYVDGPLVFTPLSITMVYAGSIFPRIDGKVSDEEYYFHTSEFHKFTKRTDTIGLACKGQCLGFYIKGQFEEMIRTPMLNGAKNQFYKEKEDINKKPYDGSRLEKRVCVYGIITEGEMKGEFFRMFISPGAFGVTYDRETQSNIPAEDGTLEHVFAEGLTRMNQILTANGRKPVQNLDHAQVDVSLTVRTNDRGNFLPTFTFKGLVAERGVDNTEEVKYIKDLRNEHERSIFGEEFGPPTPISTKDGVTQCQIIPPKKNEESRQFPADAVADSQKEAAIEVFGDDPTQPDF